MMHSKATELLQRIEQRVANVGVIGLGYVGLPLAVEFARRSIPGDLRPSFQELEEAVRAAKAEGAVAAPEAPKPE